MPDYTHWVGMVGDSHLYGRASEAPLNIDIETGHLIEVFADTVPPAELGDVVTGTTSGARGILRQKLSSTRWVLERIPSVDGLLPGLGAFAQNPSGPISGETLQVSNGSSTIVTFLATGSPGGATQSYPGAQQFWPQHRDESIDALVPTDGGDTPFWDRNAKAARSITMLLATLAGPGASPAARALDWRIGDTVTFPGGRATIIQALLEVPDPTRLTLRLIVLQGTPTAGQTLTSVTRPGNTGTLDTAETERPTGVWTQFATTPNVRSLGTFFERIPAPPGPGPQMKLLRRMEKQWYTRPSAGDRAFRLHTYDSRSRGADAQLGGVVVQTVKCSGAFPATGTLVAGTTVVGGGGWTAKILGWNVSLKLLFVTDVNGETLTAGLVAADNGAAVLSDGPALGWAKGSAYWNEWRADRLVSEAAPGATTGSPIQREGFVSMVWEADLSPHSTANQCPWPAESVAVAAYTKWIADLRTELAQPELPVVLWSHRNESQRTAVAIGPIPGAFLINAWRTSVALAVPRVTVARSDAFEMENGNAVGTLFLRTLDYVELGELFWRHLLFGQVTVPAGGYRLLPTGVSWGQSQKTGFGNAALIVATDRDPKLWPTANFNPGLSTIDENCLAWESDTLQLRPFAVDQNANGSWGQPRGTFGPEVSLWQRMKMRFSQSAANSAPFAGFKFTVNGSACQAIARDAAGCWDPSLLPRPNVTVTCTVTPQAAAPGLPARGRFTATPGTFTAPNWETRLSVRVTGSGLLLGAGGNDTAQWSVARVHGIATDGSWVDIEAGGAIWVAQGPWTFTFQLGPPPIWPWFKASWEAFVQGAFQAGWLVRTVFVEGEQGESDLEWVSTYKEAFRRVWDGILGLVAPRMKGEAGVAKCITLVHSQTPWPVPDASIAQMRAIQQEVAAELGNCAVVDPSDLALELGNSINPQVRQDNGIHHTTLAMITKGYRVDRALATLPGIPPHPNGELAVDGGAINGSTTTPSASPAAGPSAAPISGEEIEAGTEERSAAFLVEPTQQQVNDLAAAMFDAPDVAAYTTPSGLSVTRRSVDELLKLEEALRARAARRLGTRNVKVRFE